MNATVRQICHGETEVFREYLKLLKKEVPRKQESFSLKELVLQMVYFKIGRLSESILVLDNISSISGLILLRALNELTIDACYLVFKDEEERYKRFWQLGQLDALKTRICQINLGIGLIDRVEKSKEDFKDLISKWPEDYRPLIQMFSPNALKKIETCFNQKFGKPLTLEDVQEVNYTILKHLGSISNWYYPKESQHNFLKEMEPTLSAVLPSNTSDPISGVRDFYNAINTYGNTAVHSSITLNYACMTDGYRSFDAAEDSNPGFVPVLAITLLRFFQWALHKGGLLTDDGVERIEQAQKELMEKIRREKMDILKPLEQASKDELAC